MSSLLLEIFVAWAYCHVQRVEVISVGESSWLDQLAAAVRVIAHVQAWLIAFLDYESFLACWWRWPRLDPGSLSWEATCKNGYFTRDLFSEAPYFKITRTEKILRYCEKPQIMWGEKKLNFNINRQNPVAGWTYGRTVVCCGGVSFGQMPTQPCSHSPSSTRTHEKSWWVEIKTGWLFFFWQYLVSRLDLSKINLLPVKTGLCSERQMDTALLTPAPFLPGLASLLHSQLLYLLPSGAVGMGNEGLCLVPPSSSPFFPLLQHESSPAGCGGNTCSSAGALPPLLPLWPCCLLCCFHLVFSPLRACVAFSALS